MDTELGRLTELYAGLVDDQLLDLARTKAELTDAARQALEAEIERRGLTLEAEGEEAAAELEFGDEDVDPEVDPSEPLEITGDTFVGLTSFHLANQAEIAVLALEDSGIPAQMRYAMRQLTEDGPPVKTNDILVSVQMIHKDEAIAVLRGRMGLFPVLSSEEGPESDEDDGEGEALFPLFKVDTEAEVELLQKALTDAGIPFELDRNAVDESGSGQAMTAVLVPFAELERAELVLNAAFIDFNKSDVPQDE